MNEQIRELFNKASQYAYEQNPGENSYGRPVDENKYEEDRYTKFTELIVQECAKIADEGYGSDHFGNGIAGYQLLKHFGIEE